MTERLHEQLSALADDELDDTEVELLLYRYARDRELQVCWNSYQLIGESIRLGHANHNASRISERVEEALDSEQVAQPMPAATRSKGWHKILRPAGAVAVAASVGIVAVLMVRKPAPVGVGGRPPAQVVPQQASVKRVGFNYDAITSVRWDQGSAEVRDELNEFLFDHNVNAPSIRGRSMMPYVHMASLVDTAMPVTRTAAQTWEGAGQ